jgi:hypothetical protein
MTALTGFWRNATPEPPRCGARAAAHRPRHIRVGVIAIFLALHRTDGASAGWKSR